MLDKIKSILRINNSFNKKDKDSSRAEESYIKITEVSIDKNRINYKFETSKDMDKYFLRKHMFVEYINRPNIDLNSIPESILVIPLFTNLLPVAWLCNCTLKVNSLDETLYNSLDSIKNGYCEMYPELSFKGDIQVKNLEKNTYEYKHESICLFTYGVDSLTTVLRHINEKPLLATVWGADIHLKLSDAWGVLSSKVSSFSKEFNLENIYIKSDFRQFLDTNGTLNDFLLVLDNSGNWWYAIQHGIALLGQVSILAYYYRVKHIFIASSHSYTENKFIDKEIVPCASSPTLDNLFKFASCSAIHDAYELSRPDKLDVIMDYSKKNNVKFNLHVCWHSKTGENCGVCEKCARTLMYILAKKGDPEDYGFTVNDENLAKIGRDFKNVVYNHENLPGWSLHPVTLSYWVRNQEVFMEDYDYWKNTPVSWIFDIDFNEIIQNNDKN